MGFKIILETIFILSSILTVHAQQVDILYSLYNNEQIDRLKSKVQNLKSEYPENLDVQFFSALFIENGDEAIKEFENLIQKADGNLKKRISKKIAEYYYAKGYYLSADRYQKLAFKEINEPTSLEENIETNQIPSKPDEVKFVIQVGAFSLKDNAEQLQKMLKINGILSKLVTRQIKNKDLYCVWIDGKNDFEQTNAYANRLKDKYRLEYRIIKP